MSEDGFFKYIIRAQIRIYNNFKIKNNTPKILWINNKKLSLTNYH